MIDFRLYRLAFIPAVIAVIVLMFSLEGAPDAIEPTTPPATFEGERASAAARQIAELAPERPPGSHGDAAVADLVAERFGEIPAGAVTEQEFEATLDGDEVTLRNVILTLPGDADSTIVVLAARDSARGEGAASSAAATGLLIELASALGVAGHEKTFLLASTSGSAIGFAGMRELVDGLPGGDAVEAVIVISQPGAGETAAPYVVSSSTDPSSGPVQLERTAELAVDKQAQLSSAEDGWFTQLARLAIPTGLGGQAPLIAAGVDAIAISSAGERPLKEGEPLSGETLDAFGRSVQSTIVAVDVAANPLVHGPEAHLELGRNLVGGWTLSLLALALVLPALAAAIDGCARAARQGEELGSALAWAAVRSLPFLGALGALYGLAIVGAVPRPPFPFDPGLYAIGPRATVALIFMALVAALTAFGLRRARLTLVRGPVCTPPAIGAVTSLAAFAIWLANPYLALLVVPAAHVWLLAAGERRPARTVAIGIAAIAACLPAALAVIAVARALDLSGDAPWTLTLMVADGQIGLAVTVSMCFVAGALVGTCVHALRGPQVPSGTPGPD